MGIALKFKYVFNLLQDDFIVAINKKIEKVQFITIFVESY